MKESYKWFQIAVTRASSHSRIRCIKVIGSAAYCLNSIGKGKLLVIVSMYTDLFAVFLSYVKIEICYTGHLFRVYRSVAVHNVKALNRGLGQHLKCYLNICFLGLWYRHYINGCLISLLCGILYHVYCLRYCIYIGRNTDKVNGTLALVVDIGLVIAASDISHYWDLKIRIIISDYSTYILIIRELPLAELIGIEHLFAGLVAHFHIVNSGFEVR